MTSFSRPVRQWGDNLCVMPVERMFGSRDSELKRLWPGSEGLDYFDDLLEKRTPSISGIGHIKGMTIKGHGGIDMINADMYRRLSPKFLTEQWRAFMTTEAKMLTELTEEVDQALDLYEKSVTAFRGKVKNDITSAKSCAVAIEENVRRMGSAYKTTADMLTSREFILAIENAERMANALKAIAELKSHSITFAVLDKKSAA